MTDSELKLFVAVADDDCLLGHFLRHYRAIGVGRFFVAVEGSLERSVARTCSSFPVTIVPGLDTLESIPGGTAAVTAMRHRFAGETEWVALADLDEFVVFRNGVYEEIAGAEAEGANAVRGVMIDRLAADGSLPPISESDDLWSKFPVRARVTALLQRGVDHKCVLVKGHLQPAMAHHHMEGECPASTTAEIHHFKWNSHAVERMRYAVECVKQSGQEWHVEYERVLNHLARTGRFDLASVAVLGG